MAPDLKIVDIKDLKKFVDSVKASGKKVSLCQGHFNIIHPGHLRFLEFAIQQSDYLIVAVQGENHLEEKNKRNFFSTEERARSVASLYNVDKVIIFNDYPIDDVIKAVKPDIYVKGEEFSRKKDFIKHEIDLVESFGGKVIFCSGQVEYASADLLEHDIGYLKLKNTQVLESAIKRQNISIKKLENHLDSFNNLNILVIGDTIIDRYIACDALGMSSEAPVINLREIESKDYVGAAAVVARHAKALGANCHFISVIGDDEQGVFASSELQDDEIKTHFILDEERNTTLKIRYMVGNQKLLRVSRLKEHYVSQKVEKQIIECLNNIIKDVDGVIISDFNYGVITPNTIEHIVKISNENNVKLFGDSQSSSQIGDVAKFQGFDLITPTEREARIALGDKYNGIEQVATTLLDKTGVKNLVITLNEKGFISYEIISVNGSSFTKSQHFPALNVNPVDVVGAGDSLLTGLALGMCSGLNLMETSVISTGIASIAVGKVGNIPVRLEEVKKWLKDLN